MKREKVLSVLMPIISVLTVFLVWLIVSLIIDSKYILPSPYICILSIKELFNSNEFFTSLLFTLIRSLISFTVCFILSFLLAYLSQRHFAFRKFISPIIAIIRALPTIAVVLLLLFWVNSFVAPMIVTSLVILPTLYTDFINAFNSIDKNQLEICKVDRIKGSAVLFKVQLPQMQPFILNSVGANLSLNVKLMVAAEVISQTANSIGLMLNTSKAYFEISTMIALVLVTVIICTLVELLFKALSKKTADTQ